MAQEQSALQQAYQQGFKNGQDEISIQQTRMMADQFEQLRLELRAQGASQNVRTFSGEGTHRFNNWLSDINRLRTQLSADDSRTRVLCLQTLTGPPVEFVTRLIQASPDISWTTLKKELSNRYNDMADLQFARQTLRRQTQKQGESVQNYFESLLTAAKNAYVGEDIDDRFIQAQLTEIFIDGLRDDHIARKLIRQRPEKLERALTLATEEQQAARAFQLRRGTPAADGPTPMEVDEMGATSRKPESPVQQLQKRVDQLENLLRQTTINNDRANALGTAANLRTIPHDLRPHYPPPPQQPQWNRYPPSQQYCPPRLSTSSGYRLPHVQPNLEVGEISAIEWAAVMRDLQQAQMRIDLLEARCAAAELHAQRYCPPRGPPRTQRPQGYSYRNHPQAVRRGGYREIGMMPVCWHCGYYGHLQRECPQSVSPSNMSLGRSKPTCQVNFRTHTVQAVVDTGADISVISTQCYKNIPTTNIVHTNHTGVKRCFSASGEELDITGMTTLVFTLNTKNYEHNFLVIKNLRKPLILGSDFLGDHEAEISYGRRCLTIAGDEIPLGRKIFTQDITKYPETPVYRHAPPPHGPAPATFSHNTTVRDRFEENPRFHAARRPWRRQTRPVQPCDDRRPATSKTPACQLIPTPTDDIPLPTIKMNRQDPTLPQTDPITAPTAEPDAIATDPITGTRPGELQRDSQGCRGADGRSEHHHYTPTQKRQETPNRLR